MLVNIEEEGYYKSGEVNLEFIEGSMGGEVSVEFFFLFFVVVCERQSVFCVDNIFA